MTDDSQNQTQQDGQTVYVVVHGDIDPVTGGKTGAYMHDGMIDTVYTNEEDVEGIPPATSMGMGDPVDTIYYEAELNPDE